LRQSDEVHEPLDLGAALLGAARVIWTNLLGVSKKNSEENSEK
jgi:hypothetical protein